MADLMPNVSTLQSSLGRRRGIARLTVEMSRAETEVSTGRKADLFRDLGQRATESVVLRSRMTRNDNFVTSNTLLAGQLEVTALALTEIRDVSEDFLALAVGNRESKGGTVQALRDNAVATLQQVIGQGNLRFQGVSVFAGVDSAADSLAAWSEPDPATGLSPEDVIAAITGAGPTSAAEAEAMADEIAAIFDGTDPDPARRFEGVFYKGTPDTLAGGGVAPRVEARIDEGVTIRHGVQANDQPFRDLIRGLVMIASVDPAQIEDEGAYSAYMTRAVDAVAAGTSGLLAASGRLGGQQALVERTITAQEDRRDIYNSRVLALESVDPYEAGSRVKTLEAQLQASYAVASRLANLSILNFLV